MAELLIVSTPIGNMKDISFRAVETLRTVNLILSEDTRETQKILLEYQINTPQLSYRDQNHTRIVDYIKDFLSQGKDIALVSDNGTPTISDPGFKLVRELRKNNIPISIIPGPTAFASALAISGLPTDSFIFLGFLPKKSGGRSKLLLEYGNLPSTLILYESPYRIRGLLKDIQENLGNRLVCLAKDLTKKFESVKTAPVEYFVKEQMPMEKGEYVVLVAKEGYSL